MKKGYRLRKFYKFFFAINIALIVYGVSLIFPYSSLSASGISSFIFFIEVVLFLIFLYFLVATVYRGLFDRVTILSGGIEYKTFGYTIFVEWSNISNIGSYQMKLHKLDGIFANEEGNKLKVWFPSGIKMKTFIPLSMFDKNWRESELGQQIKKYAPHLFE